MGLEQFFLLVFTLGPAAAIPYGMTFLNSTLMFLVLIVCYTLPVPVILYVLDRFEEKEDYKNRIINEAVFQTKKQIYEAKKISDQITKTFIDWWGDLGYDLSLAFISYALGFIIAAFVAFFMKLPRPRAYFAIFFGNLFGLVFWFAISIGTITIVRPEFFMIFALFLAFYFYIYGKAREKRVVRDVIKKISRRVKKIGNKMK